MTLVDNYTWETEATFAANGSFKFDVKADWSINFGDNNKDGVADQSGANISVPVAGTYTVRFNDQTKVYTVEISGGRVGLYYSVTNARYPYTYSPLVGLDVKLFKGADLLSTTKISTAEHSTPYSNFDNLTSGSYKVVVDAIYMTYTSGATTRLHYTGEKTFELTAGNMTLDPLWMSVYEGAAYDITVYVNPYYNGYTAPIMGLPVNVYKDGAFLKQELLMNGGKAVGYQPIVRLNPADTGVYSLVLDSTTGGVKYTGTVGFSLTEKGPMYITPSPVLVVTETPVVGKTVHYYNGAFSQAYIHYQQDSGSWTVAPGVQMTKGSNGWFTATVTDENGMVFGFNNGTGTWDTKNGANYSTSATEVWVKNGNVTTVEPSNTVNLKVYATGVSEQYVVQVRGSAAPLSWTAGMAMSYNRNEKSFSCSFDVEGSFDYKYVMVDGNGAVIWESFAGNRTGSAGNTYTDSTTF